MLRPLDEDGKPKAAKDLSKGEKEYVDRAQKRSEELRIKGALKRKTHEDAKKALGV